jgi:hypothetical protein
MCPNSHGNLEYSVLAQRVLAEVSNYVCAYICIYIHAYKYLYTLANIKLYIQNMRYLLVVLSALKLYIFLVCAVMQTSPYPYTNHLFCMLWRCIAGARPVVDLHGAP